MLKWWHRFLVFKNIGLVVFGVLVVLLIFSFGKIYRHDELSYGATFSPKHARALGLDWQKTFLAANDDLKIKNWRLSAYWDEVEPANGQSSWEELDWLLDQSGSRSNNVILAVGARLPRWPECHLPDWTKGLTKSEREEKILNYIAQVVNRYKDNPSIVAWQVENEPFLSHFGECPELDPDFLDQEIALVRHMVPGKPIVVTDSGELSFWIPAARRADIFGTTMYRDTYSSFLNSYVHYPITPGFFRAKRNLASLFAKPKNWIVIELQAEPWAPVPYQNVSQAERDKTMSPQKFTEILDFAQQAGFREFYLWGVEWWYWEKTTNNRPDFWQEAKALYGRNMISKQ
ncbi:hypothetical protein HGA34_02855 [Candidatus Falkowbacteria bacterium]|nr:hypothetical protein [Candidatus Falkowbacteria bacterium]